MIGIAVMRKKRIFFQLMNIKLLATMVTVHRSNFY